jgi:DNA excision repair protein ERCC-1
MYYSLKYHRLHPEYVHQRIERMGQSYILRVLLLMCDIVRLCYLYISKLSGLFNCLKCIQSEHQEPIKELTKVNSLLGL